MALQARTRQQQGVVAGRLQPALHERDAGREPACLTSSASAGLSVKVRSGSPGQPGETGPGPSPTSSSSIAWALGTRRRWPPSAPAGGPAPVPGPAGVGHDKGHQAVVRALPGRGPRAALRAGSVRLIPAKRSSSGSCEPVRLWARWYSSHVARARRPPPAGRPNQNGELGSTWVACARRASSRTLRQTRPRRPRW